MREQWTAPVLVAGILAMRLVLAADGAPEGIVLLPMDGLVAVPLLPYKDIVADPAFHSYRVGRESRSARALEGPQRLVRTIPVPAGGGRFETYVAPLKEPAVVTLKIGGAASATVNAAVGRWSPVILDLPAGRSTVEIEETLEAPANAPVLWGDDRISPALPKPGHPDVVVITLDTVRPDYLTPYAPREDTTPTLAQLAREGTRFDQAISVSSWTMPAHAAILTGEYPSMDLGFSQRVEPSQLTLAEVFAAAGYNTHGASGGPYTDSTFGFQQGYRTYLDSGEWKNAEAITSWALERVTRSKRGAPLFLFLNYFDAHEPYTGVTTAEWQALDAGTSPLTPEKVARIRAGYRDGLRNIDRQLARLFDGFRLSRDWQNTVVIVAGDHGQLLGERGFLGHGLSLDEELIHVPLIVKPAASRGPARATYREQFSLIDVFDLTLELSGLAAPGTASPWGKISNGRPVRDLTFAEVRHTPTAELRARPRFTSEVVRAVRTDTTKVVQDLEGRTAIYRVGRDAQTVIPVSPLSGRLLAELTRFAARVAPSLQHGPLKVPLEVQDRLRALGYIR